MKLQNNCRVWTFLQNKFNTTDQLNLLMMNCFAKVQVSKLFLKDSKIRTKRSELTRVYTLSRIRVGSGPRRHPDNFRGRQIIPTNYLSLEREFIRNFDSFYILENFLDFATL